VKRPNIDKPKACDQLEKGPTQVN